VPVGGGGWGEAAGEEMTPLEEALKVSYRLLSSGARRRLRRIRLGPKDCHDAACEAEAEGEELAAGSVKNENAGDSWGSCEEPACMQALLHGSATMWGS
jgi:hypothetical protein